MQIPGLSTQAYKYQYNQNRYKYNGIEYDTAFGLDEYEAHFRDLDPVIGRWTTIDPDIEIGMEDQSPYSSMYNNPILKSDPLGDDPDGENGCCDFLIPSSFLNGDAIRLGNKLNEAAVKTVRQIEVAVAGTEAGALNTLTFGATPNVPFMPNSYTDDELNQFNTAFFVGQYAPMLDGPTVPMNPTVELAPVNSGSSLNLGFSLSTPTLPVTRAEVNGNSKNSTNSQHGYEINDNSTGV